MKLNALVIDDSSVMRKVVIRALHDSQLAEFTFQEAKDGQAALAWLKAQTFDILFCDWNMPNLNGYDLIKHVRYVMKSRVPIVMITTEGAMSKVEQALNTGQVDAYIVKPFTPQVIELKVGRLIAKIPPKPVAPPSLFERLAAKLK